MFFFPCIYFFWYCKLIKKDIPYLNRLFLAAQRTASLRHDDEAQAALINCLLRSYISYHLYDQADKLVSKTTFPASASNAQFARYHYYLGRIKVVQLNYSDAHTNLQQAIRRAPPPKTAPGFYQAVHKYFIVVELLMGDIPDRSLFRHVVLEKALTAYFDIVKGKYISFGVQTYFEQPLTDKPFTTSCPHRLPLSIPNHSVQTRFPIRRGQYLHSHHPTSSKCHQNWNSETLPFLFPYLPKGYMCQTSLGFGGRC